MVVLKLPCHAQSDYTLLFTFYVHVIRVLVTQWLELWTPVQKGAGLKTDRLCQEGHLA